MKIFLLLLSLFSSFSFAADYSSSRDHSNGAFASLISSAASFPVEEEEEEEETSSSSSCTGGKWFCGGDER